MNSKDTVTTEVFPLIWTQDVAALSDWAVAVLGLTESDWLPACFMKEWCRMTSSG